MTSQTTVHQFFVWLPQNIEMIYKHNQSSYTTHPCDALNGTSKDKSYVTMSPKFFTTALSTKHISKNNLRIKLLDNY